MPGFDSWIASTNVRDTSPAAKAVEAWNHILDDASSIVIARGDNDLAAQTVRIEFQNIVNERQGNMSEASHRRVWVMGVRNHVSVTDTDLANGDKFLLGGKVYEIMDVILLPGEIQADCARFS